MPYLLFILVPAAELMLILQVGSRIGPLYTLLLIVVTAVFGVSLAKSEGLLVLQRIRAALEAGRMPAQEMVDGVLILIAGALLLTPGFLTDAVGLLVLFPLTRPLFRRLALSRLELRVRGRGPEGGRGPWPPPDAGDWPPAHRDDRETYDQDDDRDDDQGDDRDPPRLA